MPRITVDLIRKRSEHNEGEISTLEELSLHQEDIEKIELLQNWCSELRILLLQSNLISKIENLNKMKRLEYLNLALNNVERVENLERCESLEKLDLTLNFIGELTSLASLKGNIHLHTLYLTGNPCTEFSGYRDYVIATLPQLQIVDAEPVLRSDRIRAIQNYEFVSLMILEQEEKYKVRREKQRQEHLKKTLATEQLQELDDPEELKKFWDEMCDNTPETRVDLASIRQKQKEQERRKSDHEGAKTKRTIRLFRDDGQPLSVNEARIPFTLTEDNENNCLTLNIEIYRHLDTSLIEADVQPKYVRVKIKGKVFQIALQEEVHPDKSFAQRSQTTGHLVIKMLKVKETRVISRWLPSKTTSQHSAIPPAMTISSKREILEIGKADTSMDFSRISALLTKPTSKENPDVPPLE